MRLTLAGSAVVSFMFAFASANAADELSADRLFDPGRLSEIQIEIPENDWRALCRQSRDFRAAISDPTEKPFTYFQGNLTIDNVKIGSVGIRKKGFIGSLDDHWPSLKIDLDQFVDQSPIPGIETLTLNNNKQDPSLVSQFLAYRLFNAAGVHAPRVGYARLTVNGEYLGVYSNIESMGKPFLDRRFGESSGKLYEGTLGDFYPSALSNLELKINRKSPDRGITNRLAQLLASKEPLDLTEIEKLVDLDEFLRFWALESLVVFWDGYCGNQNNFWVYEQKNGRLYFMPWGADMAFAGGDGFLGIGAVSVYAESMLANRLYRTDGIPERYRQTMQDLLQSVWKEDELLAAIDGVEILVADHLHQRQINSKRDRDSIRKFVSTRRESMIRLLKKWPAKVSPEPRKPVYTTRVGSAKGAFATHWNDPAPEMPEAVDVTALQLTVDGEEIVFERLSVTAQPAPKSPFGGPGGGPPGRPGPGRRGGETPESPRETAPVESTPRPASIVWTGVRASDSKRFVLTLTVDHTLFTPSKGASVRVHGTLMAGQEKFSIFNPFAGRVVNGTILFSEAGVTPGDRVAGEFEVTVLETHGGFAAKRGPGDGKNVGRPAGPPAAP